MTPRTTVFNYYCSIQPNLMQHTNRHLHRPKWQSDSNASLNFTRILMNVPFSRLWENWWPIWFCLCEDSVWLREHSHPSMWKNYNNQESAKEFKNYSNICWKKFVIDQVESTLLFEKWLIIVSMIVMNYWWCTPVFNLIYSSCSEWNIVLKKEGYLDSIFLEILFKVPWV